MYLRMSRWHPSAKSTDAKRNTSCRYSSWAGNWVMGQLYMHFASHAAAFSNVGNRRLRRCTYCAIHLCHHEHACGKRFPELQCEIPESGAVVVAVDDVACSGAVVGALDDVASSGAVVAWFVSLFVPILNTASRPLWLGSINWSARHATADGGALEGWGRSISRRQNMSACGVVWSGLTLCCDSMLG